MRAMVIDRFGGPEELHLTDLPIPEPGPGEVLVQVACTSANPADWKTRRGLLAKYIRYHFPFVLGFDLAGVVAVVGDGVTGLQPGDRVFGTSLQGLGKDGSYAEYTLAAPHMLAPLPAMFDFMRAAALPTAGITAWGALMDAGALRSGQTVLINGGAGGVGSLAIQIAKAAGAAVAVTCSKGNADYVRSLGADCVIDYRAGNVVAELRHWAPEGVDLVLDAVGQDTLLPRAIEVTKKGGSYVEIETLISAADDARKAGAAAAGVRIVSNMIAIQRAPEHLARLVALFATSSITPPAIEPMDLEQASDAHRRVEAGHVRGKIVLRIADAPSAS